MSNSPATAAEDKSAKQRPANSHDDQRMTIQAVDVGSPSTGLPSTGVTSTRIASAVHLSSNDPSRASRGGIRLARSRPKLLWQAFVALRRHCVLLIACGSSLGLGSGLGNYLRPNPTSALSEVEPLTSGQDPQIVFASTLHRHEPIGPLVRFDHLDEAVVELGRRLFHEPGLSPSGTVACASCHPLDAGGTRSDLLLGKVSAAERGYNPPTVFNSALNIAQSWEGGVSTLERYIETSITASHELGSSWERVTKFLSSNHYYRERFDKVMHGEPTPERIQSALATFQRSLITVNSKFDQWLQGTEAALGSDEFGGYFLFKKFGCISCHQGVGVGGTMFQPLGIAKPYFGNLPTPTDLGRFNITKQERDRHVFRVPSLRNVQLTAPYLHDGSIPTLETAVALMLEYQCGQEFNSEDVRRLTAFLRSLTGELPASAFGQIQGFSGH